VESLNVSAAGGGMPLKVALTKDPASKSFFVNYPIKPGKTNFEVSYAVDYAKENFTLEQKVFYPLSKVVALIYPEDLSVESEGLKQIQVDAANHVKIAGWDNIRPSSPWQIKIQGGSKIAATGGQETQESSDHEVVERPPAIAKAKWLIWGLMAVGLGLNLFLFIRQGSLSPGIRFEFSSLPAYQQKLAQLRSERINGSIDQKAFEAQQRLLLKEAWKAYLDHTHGS
jgi:hypothetical protein